jgi:hypothetical protein
VLYREPPLYGNPPLVPHSLTPSIPRPPPPVDAAAYHAVTRLYLVSSGVVEWYFLVAMSHSGVLQLTIAAVQLFCCAPVLLLDSN